MKKGLTILGVLALAAFVMSGLGPSANVTTAVYSSTYNPVLNLVMVQVLRP